MKRIILHILILLTAGQINSQVPDHDITHNLEKLFLRLEKINKDESRIQINDSIIYIIDRYASSDSVFDHRFQGIRYLGQVSSPDDMLKIITWNLILTDGTNHYFCYLIRKGERGHENSVFKLTGLNSAEPVRTDIEYSGTTWYGALYYDLRPVKIKKELFYVLLGLDFGNKQINRKIIDVLSFTDDGELVLGRKWFHSGNEIKYREVFEYSASGVMSLKFHSDKSIVFDHLVPLSNGRNEEQNSYGAEYSFDSYNFKNGIWNFERNIDVRNKK